MGTNGPTGGSGRGPGKGLLDIPKLDPQRKEQIRSGILTGIRSWTKLPGEAEPPRRESGNGRRRLLRGSGIGAGCAALALAAVLIVQTQGGEPGEVSSRAVPAAASADRPGQPAAEPGNADRNLETGPTADKSAESPPIWTEEEDRSGEGPHGVAGTRLGLTYEQFLMRWRTGASQELEQLILPVSDHPILSQALPGLRNTTQRFGAQGAGYGYGVWMNADNDELRRITFQLAPIEAGQFKNESNDAVVRYVTQVLQPDLTEAQRAELLDQLRFRDYEQPGGSRFTEISGVLYTLDQSEGNPRLIVEFARKEGELDEMGKFQDTLLPIVS
ncbi:hypothetical protein [Saccharibacillus qingshengii]|uniref:hypothetical protein n=1 Tax=Saccharibacillus qingshengii TaxID=1763540 RepID=UPI001552BC8F|nr:hypothetical protein [Saccharibacillus qingshengii]